MIRRRSRRGFPTCHVLTALSVVVLSSGLSGCATVAETVLSAAVEEVADADGSPRGGVQAPDDGGTGSPSDFGTSSYDRGRRQASVYVEGAVPGWERGPLLFGSGRGSPFFSATPYRGRCRALINLSFQDDDPFGPLDRPPVDPADMGNNLGISPDYVPFGRVMLGGAGPQRYQWEPMTLLSRSGAGCDFLWFRLISFGKDEGVETIHR
jgi:hypothetical protein